MSKISNMNNMSNTGKRGRRSNVTNSSLYPKLAMQNMRGNRKFYLPYLLALMGDAAAIYIMSALVNDPGVKYMTPNRPSAYVYVEMFMTIGMFVAYVFSFIFVRYINEFLMKQRKKELGLYNILGMGKRHIAMVMVFESLYTGIAGIGGGILIGLLLHKLVSLAIHRFMNMPVPFGFSISWAGMAQTAILFALLLGEVLLVNLNKVRASKPIELLQGGNTGEKEPKTRWLMTILGVVTLGSGYYIAIRTKTGAEAVGAYFVAVFLVIIGTYCLFTAVSIFILKALRHNKNFYYRTGPFIGVSGMLYRMRQNAVGLANICILCTMVMVMLSGTLSLYIGTEEIVREQYPGEINVTVRYVPETEIDEADGETPFDPEAMLAVHENYFKSIGHPIKNVKTGEDFAFGAGTLPDGTYTTDRFHEDTVGNVVYITCITEENYAAITGETLGLAPGEIAAYGWEGDEFRIKWVVPGEGRELSESSFPIVRHLKDNPVSSPLLTELATIVVPDSETLYRIWELQNESYGENSSSLVWQAHFDIDCEKDELDAVTDQFYQSILDDPDFYAGTGTYRTCGFQTRRQGAEDAYGMAGGFLFLGIFLGFIFLMATVLMIYYKQISEGYEDKARFEIMQKVGLSQSEVRTSIRGQVLLIFFLPIAVAAVHIVFDFNMVEKLLTLFYLQNSGLTAMCTLGTVLVFFAVYGVVYLLTARTYYKIVEG